MVRATERDVFLLTWIGEQFALPLDQLLALMNRWKQDEEPDWGPGSLSEETAKWLLKRWDRAGWVEHRKLLAGRPQWVWLSKAGLADMGLGYPCLLYTSDAGDERSSGDFGGSRMIKKKNKLSLIHI